MVEALIKPNPQIGEHNFDSNDCSEPDCPGPQRAKNGNLVCGMESADGVKLGGLGHSALVDCSIGYEISLENIINPTDTGEAAEESEEDNVEDEPQEDDEPDIYIAWILRPNIAITDLIWYYLSVTHFIKLHEVNLK